MPKMKAISIRASKAEIMAINYLATKRGYGNTGDCVRDVMFAYGGDELAQYIIFFAEGDASEGQSVDASKDDDESSRAVA